MKSLILSYQDFMSGSLKESLDPFIKNTQKFKIGESVKVKDRIGKITAIEGSSYLVMIGFKNERFKESSLEKLELTKKHKVKRTSKKLPNTKDLNI